MNHIHTQKPQNNKQNTSGAVCRKCKSPLYWDGLWEICSSCGEVHRKRKSLSSSGTLIGENLKDIKLTTKVPGINRLLGRYFFFLVH